MGSTFFFLTCSKLTAIIKCKYGIVLLFINDKLLTSSMQFCCEQKMHTLQYFICLLWIKKPSFLQLSYLYSQLSLSIVVFFSSKNRFLIGEKPNENYSTLQKIIILTLKKIKLINLAQLVCIMVRSTNCMLGSKNVMVFVLKC